MAFVINATLDFLKHPIMKLNEDSWKKQGIHLLLKQNDFWIKNTPSGPESLMLSLSNSLYFTGAHARDLELRIRDFVQENYAKLSLKVSNKKKFDLQDYLTNPRDPNYDSLNLEIASCILKRRIRIYTIVDDNLNCESFYSKTKERIDLFKFKNNCYAALFDANLKPIYALTQQLVYSIVD